MAIIGYLTSNFWVKSYGVFGSIVVIIFKMFFLLENILNNIFLFFKIIFNINTLKRFKNIKK
jgi:hypothetical protein